MPKPATVQEFMSTRPQGPPGEEQAPHPSQTPSSLPPKITRPDGTRNRKPKLQIPMQDLKGKPLRKQLEIQFPYDAVNKFPAYIWQTWKNTPADGKFNEEFREPEASWTILHPTFVHEVISDSVAPHLIKHLYASIPEVLEAYDSLPMAVMKADFFRYLILLARGGIYSDIDTTALKSAAEWVPASVPRSSYGMVIGIEADPDRPDWADWYSRRIQFCQWTIQAKPGHPIMRDIVTRITEETLRRKKKGTLKYDQKNIVEFTGPAIWTDTIFKFFNDPEYFDLNTGTNGNITWEHFTGMKSAKKVGDVVILPITSFSPGIETMGAGKYDDPMAFVRHHFEGEFTIL
jgi:alpha 1,6-mannosyltransferase